MRVICIESSIGDNPNCILVHKDSIYNVTEVVQHKLCRGSTVWYRLLETGASMHSSTIFREIDDIPESVKELEAELVN